MFSNIWNKYMSLVTIVKLWLNGLSLDVGPTGFKHHIHIHSLLMGFFSGISYPKNASPPSLVTLPASKKASKFSVI